MKNYNATELIQKIKNKGIIFENESNSLFASHDYYQVINAYKPLFVSEIEKIDDILNNIDSGDKENISRYKLLFGISNDSDLKRQVLKNIAEKYGIFFDEKMPNEKLIKKINRIKYVLHSYDKNANYKDFVRMYEFEHDLRNVLLKYVLKIEEHIKRIFINELNNQGEHVNVLVNINKYDSASDNSIKTIQKILNLYENDNSKPIARKRDQQLEVPYWILINEMTLKQTLVTIRSLKWKYKTSILKNIVLEFTNVDESSYDESIMMWQMLQLLDNIGDFRNMLAHNQPIFNFNIKDFSLYDFPKKKYEKPVMPENWDDGSEFKEENYQHSENKKTMENLKLFFGEDFYTRGPIDNVNINLSFIIYIIGKICKKFDPNTPFGMDIYNMYLKYNIFNLSSPKIIDDCEKVEKLIGFANDLDYKKFVYSDKTELDEMFDVIKNNESTIDELLSLISKINVTRFESEYDSFKFSNEYYKYTGVNQNFLNEIKK